MQRLVQGYLYQRVGKREKCLVGFWYPLTGLIDLSGLRDHPNVHVVVFTLYVVSLKRDCDKLTYGQ